MPFKEQPYPTYQPLDKSQDSIRLCKLLPGEGNDPIQCELFHDHISAQRGVYSALSYTWGEDLEQKWILLNGKPYHVQPSLRQALQALRRSNEEMLLWVDAICINQSEVAERNHQVSLMGDIYRSAKSVLLWLGPDADESGVFFDSVESFEKGLEVDIKAARRATELLDNRPYWGRAWIKQEIVLAQEIFVYCGTRSCPGDLFFMCAVLWLESTRDKEDEGRITEVFVHRNRVQDGKRDTLVDLLSQYSNLESTDVRDRVFALFSLASDCQGSISELVDYSIDTPALFFGLLAQLKPWNILEFAGKIQEALRVPQTRILEYSNKVTADRQRIANSHLEKIAMQYIREVEDYGNSSSAALDMDFLSVARNHPNGKTTSYMQELAMQYNRSADNDSKWTLDSRDMDLLSQLQISINDIATLHMNKNPIGHIPTIEDDGSLASASTDIHYSTPAQASVSVSAIVLPSSSPTFIAWSSIAAREPHKLLVRDKLFPIEGTKFALRARPMLFGYRFNGVQESYSEAMPGGFSRWNAFNRSFRIEEMYKFMVMPVTCLDVPSGQRIWRPHLVQGIKEKFAQGFGEDAVNPSIDIICFTLNELQRRKNKFTNICMVDCRWVVSALYGYRLLRSYDMVDLI
jgi:hypothetical protein